MSGSTKEVDQATAHPGDILEYTIVLNNAGDMVANALMVDYLPDHVTYVDGSVTGGAFYEEFANRIRWSGQVVPGSPVEITYQVEVDFPQETALALKVRFRNTGNVHEILTGAVMLERWEQPDQVPGLEVMDTAKFVPIGTFLLETDSAYVLPDQTRLVPSEIVEGLPGGHYRARVVILFGSDTPATLEREFDIETIYTGE